MGSNNLEELQITRESPKMLSFFTYAQISTGSSRTKPGCSFQITSKQKRSLHLEFCIGKNYLLPGLLLKSLNFLYKKIKNVLINTIFEIVLQDGREIEKKLNTVKKQTYMKEDKFEPIKVL